MFIKRDHTKLICDVGEITGLFYDAPSMEEFLQKITAMVTRHMECEVCSIYLYYADHQELVLKATKGLNPASVNNIGEEGFEPSTSCSQSKRASQLRYSPLNVKFIFR